MIGSVGRLSYGPVDDPGRSGGIRPGGERDGPDQRRAMVRIRQRREDRSAAASSALHVAGLGAGRHRAFG